MNESQRSTLVTLTGALGYLLVSSRRERRRSSLIGPMSAPPTVSWGARPVVPQTGGDGDRPIGDPGPQRAPEVEPTVARLRPSQQHAAPRRGTPAPGQRVRAPLPNRRSEDLPSQRAPATPPFEEATIARVRAVDLQGAPPAEPADSMANANPEPVPVTPTVVAAPADAAIVETPAGAAEEAGAAATPLTAVRGWGRARAAVEVSRPVAAATDMAPVGPVAPVAPVVSERVVVGVVVGEGEGLVVEGLVGRGCSEGLALRLVVGARTHELPFAVGGDLRGAVRREVARVLPRFGGLPLGGAVVAVVGCGGVGKTRVAAALAVAYGGGSALSVRAVAVGGGREGSSLVGLLAGHGVPVTVGEGFVGRERRDGELVVVDTAALSPADAGGIAVLGERLGVLEPDAVLVVLPASVGLGAARQMLAAFAPLGASGLVVTHVDETDQQGVALELSIATGVPLAYLHGGLEVRGALRLAGPEQLAGELLP